MADPNDPFKLVVTGDASVGKTSLLSILNGDGFPDVCQDWDIKNISVPFAGRNRTVLLADTAGQERFRSLTSLLYKNADVVFIVFAIDDRESFDHLDKWLEEVDRYLPNKAIPRFLVGNKIDLTDRKVTTEEATNFAKANGIKQYLETSAKENKNVQEMLNLALSSQAADDEGGGCCVIQ